MEPWRYLRRAGAPIIGFLLAWSLVACGAAATATPGTEPRVAVTEQPAAVASTATAAPIVTAEPATPMPQETAVSAEHAALIERARQQGTLRVIVTLAVPWKPEGELPDQAAVEAQRKAVADAQAALQGRLASSNVTDVTAFQFIPSMSMTVDAAALERIVVDPLVASVQEDSLAAPSGDTPAAPSGDTPAAPSGDTPAAPGLDY